MTSAIFSYCLYALLGVYAVGFVRLFVQKVNLSSTRWLIGACVLATFHVRRMAPSRSCY